MNRVDLTATAFAALGAAALARPAAIPAVFGATAPTPAARTEIRAVYGGLSLGIAGALARAARRPDAQAAGVLLTVAAASAGMAGGRLAGAALERELPLWPTGLFAALEAGGAAALLSARR